MYKVVSSITLGFEENIDSIYRESPKNAVTVFQNFAQLVT
jgi:hypothetical protein